LYLWTFGARTRASRNIGFLRYGALWGTVASSKDFRSREVQIHRGESKEAGLNSPDFCGVGQDHFPAHSPARSPRCQKPENAGCRGGMGGETRGPQHQGVTPEIPQLPHPSHPLCNKLPRKSCFFLGLSATSIGMDGVGGVAAGWRVDTGWRRADGQDAESPRSPGGLTGVRRCNGFILVSLGRSPNPSPS
jgi:hypothetical protein